MSNAGSEKLAKRLRLVPTQKKKKKKKKKQGKMRCEETRQFYDIFLWKDEMRERERDKKSTARAKR